MPTKIQIAFNAAKQLYEAGNYQLVLEKFKEITKQDPKHFEAWWYLGQCYRNIRPANLQLAIDAYTRSIKAKPDYWASHLGRGITYADLGNYQESISDLTRSIQLNSKSHYGYYYRAESYFASRELDKALADVEQALVLKNDYPSSAPLRNKIIQNRETAFSALKFINDATWRLVDVAVEHSDRVMRLTVWGARTINTGILSSAIHVAKGLADGKNLAAVVEECIPELGREIARDLTETLSSSATLKLIGNFGSKFFGTILGDIIFNDELNRGEREWVIEMNRRQQNTVSSAQIAPRILPTFPAFPQQRIVIEKQKEMAKQQEIAKQKEVARQQEIAKQKEIARQKEVAKQQEIAKKQKIEWEQGIARRQAEALKEAVARQQEREKQSKEREKQRAEERKKLMQLEQARKIKREQDQKKKREEKAKAISDKAKKMYEPAIKQAKREMAQGHGVSSCGMFAKTNNLDCVYGRVGVNGNYGAPVRYCRIGNAPFYTYNNPSTGRPWK